MEKELRILILEDNPLDAELIEFELRKCGFVFTSKIVDTREVFQKALDEFLPDIILSDYDLPTFDGLQALDIAKSKCPDAPFILVTGRIGEEFAIETLKKGVTDYVMKGNLKRLVPAINRVLEEAKLRAEHKKAEETAKEYLRLLDETGAMAKVGGWEFDVTTQKQRWTEEVYRIHEVSPDFQPDVAKGIDFYAPDSKPIIKEKVERAIKYGEPFNVELELITAKGRRIWVHAIGKAYREGEKVVKVGGTFQDITERKHIEEMLKENEYRFRTLSESLPQLVWTCQPDGPCDYLGPQWIKYTGIPEEKQLGYGWIEQLHPDDREPTISKWQSSVGAGSLFDVEFRIRRYDGVYRWFKTRAIPLKNLKGEIVKWFGTNTDIEELKSAEETIKASLEEKEVLLKEIHHRVKNNLQIVSSMLNLQAHYIKDTDVLKLFRESQNRVDTMALIHAQLYMSKDLARINFSEYLRELITNIYFSYDVQPELIHVQTDIDDIFFEVNTAIPCGLIVTELLTNCLKHAFSEGRKGKITISLIKSSERDFLLTVSDNGIGFPEGLDFRNTKTLGLRLINALAGQLGGTIEMERNSGTTFKIGFEIKGKP